MNSPTRLIGTALRYLSPLLVILLGVVVAKGLIASKKAPLRSEQPPRVLPVETVIASASDRDATFRAYGTVEPLRSLEIRPIVAGPVMSVHPNLVVGGRIDKGEVLLTIDPRDYALNLRTAKAAEVGAQADLDVERGNAAVAASEWELLGGTIEVSEESRRLALREPLVARRVADLDTAKARVEQAELDLERTSITASFDLIVLSENVEAGTTLSLGSLVATVVDRSSFALRVSIPEDRLKAIDWAGRPATIEARSGSPRNARVVRLLGEVDPEGRMARVEIAIDRPLDGETPVLLGSYAAVNVPLTTIRGAIAIPRTALRQGDAVWIIGEGSTLQVRNVEIALRRGTDVLVSGGLVEGDEVITSAIAVPLPGMLVEPVREEVQDEEGTTPQTDVEPSAEEGNSGIESATEGAGQ